MGEWSPGWTWRPPASLRVSAMTPGSPHSCLHGEGRVSVADACQY